MTMLSQIVLKEWSNDLLQNGTVDLLLENILDRVGFGKLYLKRISNIGLLVAYTLLNNY